MNSLAIPMLSQRKLNTYSVVLANGKQPRVDFAFARQPRAIKNTTRTELRGETIVWVIWLIIKREMICGISSRKIRQITRPFDAF